MVESAPVPRILPPAVSDFRRDYVRRSQPVVIEGAVAHWPAMRRWSAEYFRRRYGASEVPCFTTRGCDLIVDPRAGVLMEDASVAGVLDGAGRRVRADVGAAFPGLEEDFEVPPYCRPGLDREAFLWITPAGARTALHWDSPDNLYAHVAGEKRFLVASPRQTPLLYPHPFLSATPQFSRADLAAPDPARFPLVERALFREAVLRPGDALFLPSGWWHYAESRTLTISLNFWWLRPSLVPKAAVVALSKRWFRRAG